MVLFSWFCSIKKHIPNVHLFVLRLFWHLIKLTLMSQHKQKICLLDCNQTEPLASWPSGDSSLWLSPKLPVAKAIPRQYQGNTKAIPRPSVGRKCNEMYTTQLPFFTAFWEDSWQKRGVRYCGLITVFAWKALVYYPHIGVSLPSSMASGSFEVV